MLSTRQEAIACLRCPLADGHKQLVFGEGLGTSGLMLVGEAPGQDEDLAGHPFIGPAGRTLSKLLTDAGLNRGDAYVTNTVLRRPTRVEDTGALVDRKPTVSELRACARYLDAQIALVEPRVIVTLGATPLARLLGPNLQVERDHGSIFDYGATLIVPTFHPSSLRWRTGRRDMAVQDLRLAGRLLAR